MQLFADELVTSG